MREKIDELRDLLDLPDRTVMSIVALQGSRETTKLEDSFRSYEPSGDVAYVFVGPDSRLAGTRHENEDGSVTWTLTVTP